MIRNLLTLALCFFASSAWAGLEAIENPGPVGVPLVSGTMVQASSCLRTPADGSTFQAGCGSTNVGVGTALPLRRIGVEGTAAAPASGNSIARISDETLGAGLDLGQASASPYAFWLQPANNAWGAFFPLSLNPSGGNVGIGTASPLRTLDVNGNGVVRGAFDVAGGSLTVTGGILVGSAGNSVGTLASGEYTAVMSTQTNLDLAGGATANSWRYTRVGNQVQVAGQVTLDPTSAANTDTEAFVTLPIASNFDASADLSGSCVGFGTTDRAIQILAAVSQDQASLVWRSDTTGAILYACQFMYEVK